MKWYLYIAVVYLLSGCISLADSPSKSDSPIQPVVGYYSDGKLRYKGEYFYGYKHGTWTDWNGKGDTISIINYDRGVLSGPFKIWELEKNYENQSEFFSDYALDYGKIIIKEGAYLDGNLHGAYNIHYSSGNLKEAGKYNKGRKEGEWIKKTLSGDTLHIINYNLGEMKGPFAIWNYKTHGVFEDALISEVKIKHQGIYKINMLNGNYVETYPNGKAKCAGAYINDNREGEWTWYYPSGIIKETAIYKLGKLVKHEQFAETGK